MQKFNPSNFVTIELYRLSLIRIQEGLSPFVERPSDKYHPEHDKSVDKSKNRIDALGLFSLFTADIIKKEVLFTR